MKNVTRKRKAAAVADSPLRTSAAALPTKLFCRRPLQPSTTLRLDLNRQQPSNSYEANSAPDVPPDLLLPPKSKSYLSLLNEDEEEEDGDDDQFSLSLPRYIRERINIIDHIIKQQGEQLTSKLAYQQKNIYKMMGKTQKKKLKETTTELDKASLKIVELENAVRYLNGQIDKIQSNNKQLEGLPEVREKRLPWDMNRNAEASVYSTAHQQEVGESSQVNTIPAKMPQCKVCRKGLPTMILWPCHHLCLCKHCERAIHACPCCGTPKVSSSLVLFP